MDKYNFLMYNSMQRRSPENSIELSGFVVRDGPHRRLLKATEQGESLKEAANGNSFSQGRGSRSQ